MKMLWGLGELVGNDEDVRFGILRTSLSQLIPLGNNGARLFLAGKSLTNPAPWTGCTDDQNGKSLLLLPTADCVFYSRPPRLPVAEGLNERILHVPGALMADGVTFNGARLFFVSMLLKAARSVSSIVFHALAVAVYSLQPASNVSISAGVGGMSMPFCASGPRTVL